MTRGAGGMKFSASEKVKWQNLILSVAYGEYQGGVRWEAKEAEKKKKKSEECSTYFQVSEQRSKTEGETKRGDASREGKKFNRVCGEEQDRCLLARRRSQACEIDRTHCCEGESKPIVEGSGEEASAPRKEDEDEYWRLFGLELRFWRWTVRSIDK